MIDWTFLSFLCFDRVFDDEFGFYSVRWVTDFTFMCIDSSL
jgi:hypothetical protein